MYAILPFYWSYSAAFTITSVSGFAGIGVDKLIDIEKSKLKKKGFDQRDIKNMDKPYSLFAGFAKVIQALAAVAMLQAACLSLGYVDLGLANYKLVTITLPILIEIFTLIINQKNGLNISKQIVNQINDYFGCMSMTAALVSALIIVEKIGCFDLLPLAIVSTSAYLIYRAVKTYLIYTPFTSKLWF